MNVSVVIPTFNKAPRLKLMLASAVCQDFNLNDAELLLVDDGSTHETNQVVAEYKNKLNLILLQENHGGRSFARNRGIAAASGKIVIFSDDDVIWKDSFLKTHYQMHQLYDSCVVHGQIRTLPFVKFFEDPASGKLYKGMDSGVSLTRLRSKCISETDISLDFEGKVHKNSNLSVTEKMINSVFTQGISSLQWLGCTGANFSVSLEDLKKVRGFDEGFGLTWGFEDFELGYRLKELGCKFLYSMEATNYHLVHFRQTLEEELKTSFDYFYSLHPQDAVKEVYEFFLGKIDEKTLFQRRM